MILKLWKVCTTQNGGGDSLFKGNIRWMVLGYIGCAMCWNVWKSGERVQVN